MKDKAFEKVTEYIDAMAAKLGVAAEHVYGILVKQQIAEGIASSIVGLILLAASVSIVLLIIGAYTKAEYGEAERFFGKKPSNLYAHVREFIDDLDGLFALVFVVIFLVTTIVGMCSVYEGILSIINPEYYAIKELLDVVGGDK